MDMREKSLGLIAGAALLGAVSAPASAEFNYNYADVAYLSEDAVGFSFTGFGIEGSFAANKNINVIASYASTSNSGFAITPLSIGVGYHDSIDDKMDWFTRAQYKSVDIFGIATTTGYSIGGGIRMAASKEIEVNVSIDLVSMEGGSGTSYGVGGVYNIDEQFGVSLAYKSNNYGGSENINGFGIGARINF